jgi:hypothetical protein
MRIVVWNCKMALSRKRQRLYDLRPDVAVIPECAKKCLDLCIGDGFDGRWFGDNPNKGLGVLIRQPWRIARVRNPANKWIVPLWIVGGSCDFLLVAVWAMPIERDRAASYIGQVYDAVVKHPQWFRGNKVIVAGDFNSNKFWDEKREGCNHSAVVRQLRKYGLVSAYHRFFSERQGAETRPTYYFWHHQDRGYHIDYVFFPKRWAARTSSVEVGAHAPWSKLSDHVPLAVDVALL